MSMRLVPRGSGSGSGSLRSSSGNAASSSLLFIGFNQDLGCFACGTTTGFITYNCDPLKERFRRVFENGGIGIVEMLWRCNILALVGGGRSPKYPPNKVMIWDDFQNKCIAELEFRSEVIGVRLRRDRIVVVLRTKVYVYNFADLQVIDGFETIENARGLCSISRTEDMVLAFPSGETAGEVIVKNYSTNACISIVAHESALAQIVLNSDGTLLATCSQKGTLVRIFDTMTGRKLGEFRRGADNAHIYCISFDAESNFLCVSSDKGTVHIYKLGDYESEAASSGETRGSPVRDERGNRQSSVFKGVGTASPLTTYRLSFMGGILGGYFNSQWSFAQFAINTGSDPRCLCCFGAEQNTVVVVCANGSYYKYKFDAGEGGEAMQEGFAHFYEG